jgi:methylenetetrahydrofolate dehydrogenase (NADP+) / methenyltetrahydrofolate cyclohydrolase
MSENNFILIDGKETSNSIKEELKIKTDELIKNGTRPGLAVLLVGEDAASGVYVRSKEKSCLALGFHSVVERWEAESSEEKILEQVEKWNLDDEIHGILVQLPLPKHINEEKVLLSINPEKDVDGFHPVNLGKLMLGIEGHQPCTPKGIVELLARYDIETSGKHCVVVGRSNIVGKPITNLMYQKSENANCIVTICHSAAEDLSYYTKQADILIAAVGRPEMITSDMVKDGVVIVDVGINRVEDQSRERGYRLCGDVDFDSVKEKCSAITPVPGGVGPMTIAMLMQNTYDSAVRFSK